jgi:hypothetical protein
MNVNFYIASHKLFINGYLICDFHRKELIHRNNAISNIHIFHRIEIADVLPKYDFCFGEDKYGKYICPSWFAGYDINIPKCLQRRRSIWSIFCDERPRIYLDQIRNIKEEVNYELADAPQICKLTEYPTDLVIEYFKERGLSFCPLN